jgi:hypothetical protein
LAFHTCLLNEILHGTLYPSVIFSKVKLFQNSERFESAAWKTAIRRNRKANSKSDRLLKSVHV